ncbi:hypothetical protein [Micromonospora sp. M61]|uniref:hypothetical protein n=1 Tax=Micromonospora zamorensis TaxID=709883 RepID=UPI001B359F7C|nr:hypothetical protein [Micromonospora sp. M61]
MSVHRVHVHRVGGHRSLRRIGHRGLGLRILGRDGLVGRAGRDRIVGRGGRDRIVGRRGRDRLVGRGAVERRAVNGREVVRRLTGGDHGRRGGLLIDRDRFGGRLHNGLRPQLGRVGLLGGRYGRRGLGQRHVGRVDSARGFGRDGNRGGTVRSGHCGWCADRVHRHRLVRDGGRGRVDGGCGLDLVGGGRRRRRGDHGQAGDGVTFHNRVALHAPPAAQQPSGGQSQQQCQYHYQRVSDRPRHGEPPSQLVG